MHQYPVLEMLCVRHGATRYTGVFPDLTPEGEAHVRAVADGPVSDWVDRHGIDYGNLALISSPAPRAMGTAAAMKEVLCYPKEIIVEPMLDAMAWRDPVRAREACMGMSGKGYIDYETEPAFRDGAIFETPEEVRARWYGALADHIVAALELRCPHYALLFSHYELFSHLVRDCFGIVASAETALQHAELIELSAAPSFHGTAMLTTRFRGDVKKRAISLKEKVLLY